MDCICAKDLVYILAKGLTERSKAILSEDLNESSRAIFSEELNESSKAILSVELKEKAEAWNPGKFRDEVLDMSISRGWADAVEVVNPEKPLERRHIAAILHRFIKKELGEKDEEDISRAQVLNDLYDCHVCVNHIAQVWLKGIMDSRAVGVFGTNDFMSISEAEATVKRVFYPVERLERSVIRADRNIQNSETHGVNEPKKLSFDEALRMAESIGNALIVDVRTENEYMTGHIKGAVNFPMAKLVERYANDARDYSDEGDAVTGGRQCGDGRNVTDGRQCSDDRNVTGAKQCNDGRNVTGAKQCSDGRHASNDRQDREYFYSGGEGCVEDRLRNSVCLLYCGAGYQSRVAAECLAAAGISEVYYFAYECV